MALVIDDLRPEDREAWLTLWDANNQGHSDPVVTKETWNRLMLPVFPVHGLAARKDGTMAGFVHYILHPVTGSIMPAAYMQDLFVAPEFRRQGVARALVAHLAAIGRKERWARLYWLADNANESAQRLYKTLGSKMNFSLHIMPLG